MSPGTGSSGGPLVVPAPGDLLGTVGTSLGPTASVVIDQDRIDRFADATGDHQWIHVDVERAIAESPYGKPIAHGYLTLALVNLFLPQLIEVQGFSMGVNVGVDRVRFPAPVRVGDAIGARGEVISAEELGGGVQVVVRVTVTVDGSDRPACVADTVSRYYP